MTKTEAKRQAHKESHMYRQGSGWIVSTWSPARRCNVLTQELPYQSARYRLSDFRSRRADELMTPARPKAGIGPVAGGAL